MGSRARVPSAALVSSLSCALLLGLEASALGQEARPTPSSPAPAPEPSLDPAPAPPEERALPSWARAEDDPEELRSLDPPSPLDLPDLDHAGLRVRGDFTLARIRPSDSSAAPGAGARGPLWASVQQVDAEYTLRPGRWYLGGAQALLQGQADGAPPTGLLGNPELWLRGAWSHHRGLSTGGSLGAVLPVPRSLSDDEARVLRAARSVRPWDSAYFDDLTLTLRPALEFRYVVRGALVQLRQGLDLALPLGDSPGNEEECGEGGKKLCAVRGANARSGLFVGYQLAEPLGLGCELWQTYQLTSEMSDARRATVAISPLAELRLRGWRASLSPTLPLGRPLRGDAQSYLAVRLNLAWTLDAIDRP